MTVSVLSEGFELKVYWLLATQFWLGSDSAFSDDDSRCPASGSDVHSHTSGWV